MEINRPVVTGFTSFNIGSFHVPFVPVYAKIACLSEAEQALWTNRVPMHEPWPRVMKGDTLNINDPSDEYKKNVHHNDQYDNVTTPDGIQPIGRIEGDEEIERKDFWRR